MGQPAAKPWKQRHLPLAPDTGHGRCFCSVHHERPMNTQDFTEEQKRYLEGFAAGADLRKAITLPQLSSGPADIHRQAQDRQTAAGKKLVAEENAKRDKNALDLWDEVAAHAKEGKFP